MKTSEVIAELTKIKKKFGDLPVIGGDMSADAQLSRVCVVDKDGMEVWPYPQDDEVGEAIGVYLEGR